MEEGGRPSVPHLNRLPPKAFDCVRIAVFSLEPTPSALSTGQPDLRTPGSLVATRLTGRAISKYCWLKSSTVAAGSSSSGDSELNRSVTFLTNSTDLPPLFRGEIRPGEDEEDDEDDESFFADPLLFFPFAFRRLLLPSLYL